MVSIERPNCANRGCYHSKMYRICYDTTIDSKKRTIPIGWFCKVCRNVIIDVE